MGNSVWDDQRIVDALIDMMAHRISYTCAAKKLSDTYRVKITTGGVAGKVSRLRESGIVFPEKEPGLKRGTLDQATKAGVVQDIKDGFPLWVVASRNSVSEDYARRRRKKLIADGVAIVRPVGKNPDTRKRSRKRVANPAPSTDAVILRFPPAAPTARTCEFLSGDKKPWVKCTHPAAYHTSWCEEHGKIVFNVWPPQRHQDSERKYG